MHGQTSAVTCLENQDRVAEQPTPWPCFQIVQGQACVHKARFAPVAPPLFDGGQLVFEFLTDEACEALQVVLATVPTHGRRPVVNLARHRGVPRPAVHPAHPPTLGHAYGFPWGYEALPTCGRGRTRIKPES